MISKFSIFALSSLFLYFTSYTMELPCNERDELIKTLYNNANKILRCYKQKNENSREKIINFLNQFTHEDTKQHCINEDNIIVYAYEKQDGSFDQKNEQFTPLTSISKEQTIVFCARIKEYHLLLKKNNFTTPSSEDFNNYLENKRITKTIKKTILLSNEIGIHLNEKEALSITPPYHVINKNTATREFETLLKNIDTILQLKSDELEDLATIIVSLIKKYTACTAYKK